MPVVNFVSLIAVVVYGGCCLLAWVFVCVECFVWIGVCFGLFVTAYCVSLFVIVFPLLILALLLYGIVVCCLLLVLMLCLVVVWFVLDVVGFVV